MYRTAVISQIMAVDLCVFPRLTTKDSMGECGPVSGNLLEVILKMSQLNDKKFVAIFVSLYLYHLDNMILVDQMDVFCISIAELQHYPIKYNIFT